MKKLLICSTAIVAAGMIASPASAADKIKLGLGGFMDQWIGTSTNKSSYLNAQSGQPNIGGFDVKGDSEVHVLGSTKLDNGITVSVKWEMETDAGAQSANVDESSVNLSSPTMGTIILGADDMATSVMHHTAPEVGLALDDGDYGNWIQAPSANIALAPTEVNPGASDDYQISYISPSFSGFTFGAGFRPDTDGTEAPQSQANDNSGWSAGVAYDGELSGVTIGVDATYGVVNDNKAAGTQTAARKEAALGASIGFGAFTIGGAYKNVDQPKYAGFTSVDGSVWIIGGSYTSGPASVSIGYFHSEAEGNVNTAADDKKTVYQLSGSYDLGGGIALAGSVLKAKFDDETTAAGNNNEGWAALAGVRVSF